jgi:hypothetical protein
MNNLSIGNISTKIQNVASSMAYRSMMHGVPKQPVLASSIAITSVAALYLIRPETIVSQLTVIAIAAGSALMATEGVYYTARKIKNHLAEITKGTTEITKEEENELSNLLDSLDLDAVLKNVNKQTTK